MVRFVFRLLGTISLAVAVIFAVLDATRSVAAGRLVMTPLGESWAQGWPDGLAGAEEWLAERLGAWAWNGAEALLLLPGFALFGLLALLFLALGRRPVVRATFGRTANPGDQPRI
ncbi:MAG: hypothetical protein DI629_01025 [Mesorhizobium amorphae]|nr:MAG: hypothetical protein DI629_01025 [Mesorhizobium amorphae]